LLVEQATTSNMAAGFFNATAAIQRFTRMAKSLKFECDKVASKTISATRQQVRASTPVGYTGETRRAWAIERRNLGSYRTFNKTNAAWFLEGGTRAHGPVVKRALFIPLNKRAFFVYRANTFPPLKKAKRGQVGDYILVKSVKGISPRRMAGDRVGFAALYGKGELIKMLSSL
jgi:hypothetical protein